MEYICKKKKRRSLFSRYLLPQGPNFVPISLHLFLIYFYFSRLYLCSHNFSVLNACIRSCRANRCQSKALLSETMIYKQVIIYQSDSDMYLRPLLKLQVSDLVNYNGLEQSYNKNNTVYFQKTRYRILENSPGMKINY